MRNKKRKEAISSLVSAAKKAAIDEGTRENISEELVDRVILKELKSAKEQLDTCPAERGELKAEYQLRYDVIKEYAPSMMTKEEVQTVLTEKFADIIATKNRNIQKRLKTICKIRITYFCFIFIHRLLTYRVAQTIIG